MPAPNDPEKRRIWIENLSKSHKGQIPKSIFKKGQFSGDKNPSKRPEVRKKISEAKKGIKNLKIMGENHPCKKKEVRERISKSLMGHKLYPNSGNGKGSWYDSPLQGKIWLRSSYELAYAKCLDSMNILWKYENIRFDLNDTTYTPDFYIIKEDKFVEVKGYMTTLSQQKINDVIDKYSINLEILYKEDLIKLGCDL